MMAKAKKAAKKAKGTAAAKKMTRSYPSKALEEALKIPQAERTEKARRARRG